MVGQLCHTMPMREVQGPQVPNSALTLHVSVPCPLQQDRVAPGMEHASPTPGTLSPPASRLTKMPEPVVPALAPGAPAEPGLLGVVELPAPPAEELTPFEGNVEDSPEAPGVPGPVEELLVLDEQPTHKTQNAENRRIWGMGRPRAG
jgi:hypothetical protein